jgi:hypothetical protein
MKRQKLTGKTVLSMVCFGVPHLHPVSAEKTETSCIAFYERTTA